MPSPATRHTSPRRTSLLVVFGALALLVVACSSDAKPRTEPHATSTAPPSTGTTLPGQNATPRATAAEAVQVLLAAERGGDHATAYRLLSPAARNRYPTLADWKERRTELAPITSFAISGDAKVHGAVADVVVEVRHKPGLDPFIGLSAARERQTWVARRKGSGWLVDADPSVAYELPPLSRATSAVRDWTRAVQACDKVKASGLQAVDELYGSAAGADTLCHSKGDPVVGKVAPLQAGPSSADLIAQYSTDALSWARTVRITAPSGHFSVVVAPLGDVWKVIGLTD